MSAFSAGSAVIIRHDSARTESTSNFAPRINTTSAGAGKDTLGEFAISGRDACIAADPLAAINAFCRAQCRWSNAS